MTLRNRTLGFLLTLALLLSFVAGLGGCSNKAVDSQQTSVEYASFVLPLSRNGVELHLECTTMKDSTPEKNILLTHGVTYSSHEFDIDYKDYSLVRRLAREGYAVWRLDIAGFGQSGEVEDGFIPDSDYAAEDINAAVEKIVVESGQDKIDVLGWSWGTVTAGRFAAKHPEHIGRLVLYAPILSGIGEYDVNEDYHHNTWEHAADDFQRGQDGEFDLSITEPEMIEMFCSSCWHYDGEYSPNGGRRDICVGSSETLIPLSELSVPTLIICGSNDPYLNYDLISTSLDSLPEGSAVEVIKGGAHVIMYEAPYYRDFQKRLISFLKN